MNPKELFSFRKTKWFEDILTMSFLTAVAAVGLLAMAVYGGDGSFLEGAGLGAMVIVIVGIVGAGLFSNRYESQREEAIWTRLEPLTTAQLAALSSSPEVGKWDRRIVIQFLNKNRAGWSFTIDTTNTTAS